MASDSWTQMDWYSILGAHPSNSQAELKQKYQKLVLLPINGIILIQNSLLLLMAKMVQCFTATEMDMTCSCPVDSRIQLEEMDWEHDEEYYYYTCRCGGRYILAEGDLDQSSLVNCDSCSLIIEVYRDSQEIG
ncbi:dnaJ homolog subfamily C member 24 isoform X2 [Hyperolius riggenbachi]|uniref:dnaJ homolog subfamily C member 24 isoform X2 n=1 Tax=Hyperolius riggenbachi TaxID=752182 RepID=UPI0035A2C4E7